MKDTKVVVPVGGNVIGNIGSCEIKETSLPIDSFNEEVIAVNSCNGNIVSQYKFHDWSFVYYPIVIIVIIIVGAISLRVITSD